MAAAAKEKQKEVHDEVDDSNLSGCYTVYTSVNDSSQCQKSRTRRLEDVAGHDTVSFVNEVPDAVQELVHEFARVNSLWASFEVEVDPRKK
jgi:hypothetical protein